MVEIKLLKCPSCGSSEIKKQTDSLHCCQHCGSQLILKNNKLSTTQKNSKYSHPIIEKLALLIVTIIVLAGAVLLLSLLYFLFRFSYKLIYPDTNDKLSQNNNHEKTVIIDNNQIENKPYIEVLSQVQGKTRNGSLYWVLQLKNSGASAVKDITASVSLFDKNEVRIEEKKSWPLLKFLLPQQTTEMVISIPNPPIKFERVEINGYAKIANNKSNQFVLEVDQYFVNANKDKFDIIGDLTNSNDFELDNINVIAVALDEKGVPLGHGYNYATRISLPAKEKTGFKVNVHTYLAKQPVSWKVYAIARKNIK